MPTIPTMIWGRSTLQWTGLVTALAALIQTVAVIVDPPAADTIAVVLGALVAFCGVLIAFIANDVTPTADPHVPEGTLVKTVSDTGEVVGTTVATKGVDSADLSGSKQPSNGG